MSGVGDRAVEVWRGMTRVDLRHFDLRTSLLGAGLVVTPLVVGFLLGLAQPAVLVTIGALNLLLLAEPFPEKTAAKVVATGVLTNASAFAAGTAIATLPVLYELPLVGAGVFVALALARGVEWENAGLIAAVMLAFAVGVPPTTAPGLFLRPAAVLLGGIWALSALFALSVLGSSLSLVRVGSHRAPTAAPSASGAAVTVHAGVVAATATLGLLLGHELGLPRDYWIVLTVLVALRLDLAATLSFSSRRIVGTIVGAAAAFFVTTLTSDPWILLPVLVATTTLVFASRGVNYVVNAIGITLTVIVLLNLVYSGGPSLALARVIDTVIGGSLALVVSFGLSQWLAHRPRLASDPD